MAVKYDHINSSSPTPPSQTPDLTCNSSHTFHMDTIIPNRIFVGGIDLKVNENELRHVFSQYGAVQEVNVVKDRSGMSKGYGFITFETQEDALKVLHVADGIWIMDKKLRIGQAVRKQQASGKNKHGAMAIPTRTMSCGSFYRTTSTGCPYIYQNGVAYFHSPSPSAHLWPPVHPVMFAQSIQPAFQRAAYDHCQCLPHQYQWNITQTSCPLACSQPSEYLYQPSDGGSVHLPLGVMEDAMPEVFPPAHLLPKCCHYTSVSEHHYLTECHESAEPCMLHASQLPM
ncbi:protein boule-like [Thalassophryne amazonica]|uniref:protein boule-like n=1 Tax=Thalassophryne amazonica TaxID=390379 RepID=UPI001470E424|nr:protein boule-like [Thalassophryne amazonica]